MERNIQALLDERTVIVSWYADEVFLASCSSDPASIAPPPDWLLKKINRTIRRSWHGTHDREICHG